MRIRKNQADHLYMAYIMSSFNYCLLVWMFCSKTAYNLIDKTHHIALCARFNTFHFNVFKLHYGHTKNIQLLVVEIFKSLHQLNLEFMWDSFVLKPEVYNLRQGQSLNTPRARFIRAINSLDICASLAWNYLPADLKYETSLSKFKSKLKVQKIYCKCKNCD